MFAHVGLQVNSRYVLFCNEALGKSILAIVGSKDPSTLVISPVYIFLLAKKTPFLCSSKSYLVHVKCHTVLSSTIGCILQMFEGNNGRS